MEPYAVVETGSKQYKVTTGDVVHVERLEYDVGATIQVESVLALSDGKELRVGTPELKDATVSAEVVDHIRGPKLISYKKKRRKGYSRKLGHRQNLTVLKVVKID